MVVPIEISPRIVPFSLGTAVCTGHLPSALNAKYALCMGVDGIAPATHKGIYRGLLRCGIGAIVCVMLYCMGISAYNPPIEPRIRNSHRHGTAQLRLNE